MISIPGCLSFSKLVIMSSAPAKSAGGPDTRLKIHSFGQRCPIQSRLQSVLEVRSFYVERNNEFMRNCLKVIYVGCWKLTSVFLLRGW